MLYPTFEPTSLRYESVDSIPAEGPMIDRDIARCSALGVGGGGGCKATLPDSQKPPEFSKACSARIFIDFDTRVQPYENFENLAFIHCRKTQSHYYI